MSNFSEAEPTGRSRRRRWPIVLVAVVALLVGGGAGYAVSALTARPVAPAA